MMDIGADLQQAFDEGYEQAERVYQKAFEDIRAEIWDSGMNMGGEYQGVWIRYRDIEKILDKHNPDKVGKERE